MRIVLSLAAVAFVAAAAVTGPALALAECDLTGLRCKEPGKKCDIKFRNKTADVVVTTAGGHNMIPRPTPLRISARDGSGDMAGSNAIKIQATDSKDFNLDKKKGFAEVLIKSAVLDSAESVRMSCRDIRATLSGNGKCDVLAASSGSKKKKSTEYYLVYICSGSIISAKP